MATHSTNLGNDMLMNLESPEAAVGAVEDRADVGHCATVAMAAGGDLERVADNRGQASFTVAHACDAAPFHSFRSPACRLLPKPQISSRVLTCPVRFVTCPEPDESEGLTGRRSTATRSRQRHRPAMFRTIDLISHLTQHSSLFSRSAVATNCDMANQPHC